MPYGPPGPWAGLNRQILAWSLNRPEYCRLVEVLFCQIDAAVRDALPMTTEEERTIASVRIQGRIRGYQLYKLTQVIAQAAINGVASGEQSEAIDTFRRVFSALKEHSQCYGDKLLFEVLRYLADNGLAAFTSPFIQQNGNSICLDCLHSAAQVLQELQVMISSPGLPTWQSWQLPLLVIGSKPQDFQRAYQSLDQRAAGIKNQSLPTDSNFESLVNLAIQSAASDALVRLV